MGIEQKLTSHEQERLIEALSAKHPFFEKRVNKISNQARLLENVGLAVGSLAISYGTYGLLKSAAPEWPT